MSENNINTEVMVADAITPAAESVTLESQLTVAGQQIVADAKAMRIVTAQDYEQAGAALRRIKEQANKVKDFWAEPKKAAQSAHKAICNKEKQMLSMFTEAETIIKGTMKVYLDAVEKARREQEEEVRRRQQEEAMRLVDEAAKAEAAGDEQTAAINMAMAEMVSDMGAVANVEAPKAAGISTRKTWKAKIVDEKAVPAYAMGMEIRKIDMSALNNIARMSKGTAEIPGVEFVEELSVSARV